MLVSGMSAFADDSRTKGVESLSPETRSLLREEMLEIQSGMMSVIAAYASGDLEEIASIAKSIEDSYILRQKMSRQQMHELHQKLPSAFVQLDQQFHVYAGSLADAATSSNGELVVFYYSKLVESCSACHSKHAKHRFPAFRERNEKDAHH
jgi:hypothetical protein